MNMKCCVPSCTSNDNHKNCGVSFHRFPKDDALRDKWLQCIPRRNWIPGRRDVVCSLHFQPSSIDHVGSKKRVIPDAIPIYFDKDVRRIRGKPKGRPKGAKNKNQIIYMKIIEYKRMDSDSNYVEIVTHESSTRKKDMENCQLYEIIEFEEHIKNH